MQAQPRPQPASVGESRLLPGSLCNQPPLQARQLLIPLAEHFVVLATGIQQRRVWGSLAVHGTTSQVEDLRKRTGPVIQASAAVEHALKRLAKVLGDAPSDLRIEGHTDNVPIHNARFASNWDLSTARATTTIRLLVANYDFDPRRLAAAGYAEYRPIAANSNPVGRALNRRVDIVVPRKAALH